MKNTDIRRFALLAGVAGTLAACGHIQIGSNDTRDYRQAVLGPGLAVPQDLLVPAAEDLPARPPGSANAASATPAATETPEGPVGVSLSVQGGQDFLTSHAPPPALWPRIQAYLTSQGFKIDTANAATGTIVTQWRVTEVAVQKNALQKAMGGLFPTLFSAKEHDRWRVVVTPTAAGSAIFLHRQAARGVEVPNAVTGGTTHRWELQPESHERDVEALAALGHYLGLGAAPAASATGVAQTTPGSGASDGTVPPGWAALGGVLIDVGAEVDSVDVAGRTYVVSWAQGEGSPSQYAVHLHAGLPPAVAVSPVGGGATADASTLAAKINRRLKGAS